MKITVTETACPKVKPEDESQLGFARTFSDHMFVAEYEEGRGWYDPRILPYQKIALDPASPVFHYAQEIFEGAKAYALDNGEVGLFRIEDNARACPPWTLNGRLRPSTAWSTWIATGFPKVREPRFTCGPP